MKHVRKGAGALMNFILRETRASTPPPTEDVFDELYPQKSLGQIDNHEVKQRNTGNCYFVAALYQLKQNPIFERIIRRTITKNDEGWEVCFLGDPENQKIQIRPEDLGGQEVWDKKKGKMIHKLSISGAKGDVILERAFGRKRKQMGQNKQQAIHETFGAMEGGFSHEPLQMLLGDICIQECSYATYNEKTLSEKPRDRQESIDLLKKVSEKPNEYIVVGNTPVNRVTPYTKVSSDGERKYYMDPESFFMNQHAFAIKNVSFEQQQMEIINPHDTLRLRMYISFKEFINTFSNVSVVRLIQANEEMELEVKARKIVKRLTMNPYWKLIFKELEKIKIIDGDDEFDRADIVLKECEDILRRLLATYSEQNQASPSGSSKDFLKLLNKCNNFTSDGVIVFLERGLYGINTVLDNRKDKYSDHNIEETKRLLNRKRRIENTLNAITLMSKMLTERDIIQKQI